MDKLDVILKEIESLKMHMVTRDDIADMVRKDDLADFVRKDDISELHQITRALRDGQEELKAQMDSLTATVIHIQGDIAELKDGQLRQDKILESLALRSLEQETEIREIKRIK